MPNFVPKLEVTKGIDTTSVTFDSPPEGDPYNERITSVGSSRRTLSGKLVKTNFYKIKTYTLNFTLQPETVKTNLELFLDKISDGTQFRFYRHSDEIDFELVDMESNNIAYERVVSDGQGKFLYSFEISFQRVL